MEHTPPPNVDSHFHYQPLFLPPLFVQTTTITTTSLEDLSHPYVTQVTSCLKKFLYRNFVAEFMSPTLNDFPPSVKTNKHNVRRFSRCTNDTGFAHVYNLSNYHARTQRLSDRRATNCKENKTQTQTTQTTLIQLPTMRHSKPKNTTIPGFSQAKPRLTHTHTPLSNPYCFQVLSLGGVGGVRSKIQRCLGVVSFPPPLLVRQPPHNPLPHPSLRLPYPSLKLTPLQSNPSSSIFVQSPTPPYSRQGFI
jgi:hypothetical protein